ncbi:unnamed protein product [Spirodela intermedia]|uniref:Uncharacterized protein n=1 Tax=Spirodela intermedia TaxID=51605 RepID=A0A7I8IFL7_SPIIN|nr:unnamed protein product [Spirodela intermedia]CAA6656421.1 unnamed protein product [Spirodela intermedia]
MEIVTSADTFRSVVDLLLFHSLDRQVYSRLVRGLQQDPQNVKRAMGLWLWLESIGHNDFVRHVNSYRDGLLIGFLREAEMCISAVMGWLPPGCDLSIPLTAWLIDEPIDVGFFLFNKQIVFNGVSRIYARVCDVIFNDSLMLVISQDGSDLHHGGVVKGGCVIQPSEEWMSRHGATWGQWLPASLGSGGWWRSLTRRRRRFLRARSGRMIALSTVRPQGLPLWRGDPYSYLSPGASPSASEKLWPSSIREFSFFLFFFSRYGHCLENVMIEQMQGEVLPMYGRIVFINPRKMASVMNGRRSARFEINGNYLWARMYEPSTARQAQLGCLGITTGIVEPSRIHRLGVVVM